MESHKGIKISRTTSSLYTLDFFLINDELSGTATDLRTTSVRRGRKPSNQLTYTQTTMLSLRRLYFSANGRTNSKAVTIATPGSRTMNHPISRGGNGSASSPSSRKPVERAAVAILLLMAWAWIMVFLGMIFYHGYQHRYSVKTATVSGGGAAHNKGDAAVYTNVDRHASPLVAAAQKESVSSTQQLWKQKESPNDELTMSFRLESHGSPLLVFTCQRANYLRETLDDILKFIPSDCSMGCPVVLSQDGNDPEVYRVISEFQTKFLERKGLALIHLEHKSALRRGNKSTNSYQALATHYGWALRQVFDGNAQASKTARLPQRVLILEEDIHIAPDFFDYFTAMAPILDTDNTLLAVSAFNDNGFKDTVKDTTRVLRSDFFPGLGWMMTRKLWTNELQLKWPNVYWDDWLREPDQRVGRHVLRPEVSRTFHFGVKGGVSNNQFGDKLTNVWLNNERVDWKRPTNVNTYHWSHYLQNQEKYDRYYWNLLQASQLQTTVEEALTKVERMDVRLEYNSLNEFQRLARSLKPALMDDEKSGIPRTAYKGVVETRPHGDHFLFLTPTFQDLQKQFASATAVTTLAEDAA